MRAAALAAALVLSACAGWPRARPPRVMTGLDVLEADGFAELRGKRVGVLANASAIDASGRPILDVLAAAPGVRLAAVFSPEHGFTARSETKLPSGDAIRVGGRTLPLHNLYYASMRPTPEDLKGLDVLVFDVQDVGARFFTYLATMAMAMEETKKAGVEFMVLDRPNPIGGEVVEGPVADQPDLLGSDIVGYFPVPTRHGLTAGEMALLHNAALGHPRLTVVKMRGWRRAMWFDETGLPWVAPSPNMPDLASATLYPGTASLEFTNLSMGRGTPEPFRWIGAPWLDAEAVAEAMNAARLPGVSFAARSYTPSKSDYAGRACRGVSITVTDRAAVRPLRVFAHLVTVLRDLQPKDFELQWKSSRRLIGWSGFEPLYDSGADAETIARAFDAQSAAFLKTRAPYLLYK